MSKPEYLARAQEHCTNLRKRHNVKRKGTVSQIDVVRQGNFTVVTINGSFVGVAKRHPKFDRANPLTGFHTALDKALRYMLKIA